jgi:hypothetical protein
VKVVVDNLENKGIRMKKIDIYIDEDKVNGVL